MALKPIEILINAKDNASGVFSSLQSKVAAVGTAIAAYFGINAFVGIVQGAADLEQAMSRVEAATGATAEEMAALRKAAEEAGANTRFSATEAAGALENLAKAGLSSTDAIAALPAVLNLAAAGDLELATSAEFVTKAVTGMGLSFAEAGRVADVLALGANATNTSVTGLAQALSFAAPVAQSLGLSLESTVAIIGKFADAGIDASRAGTALNSILSQFSNPASKFREELAAAGITTNDFERALAQLAAAGPAGSRAIIAVGQEAGPALRALLNQGIGALSDLKARLEDSQGSAAQYAKILEDDLKGAFKNLTSAWDTVRNALGTPVLPVLTEAARELADVFRRAVADGSVGRFGESIATAFKNGLQFVREFIAGLDFGAVLQGLQRFADDVNVAMVRVGEYATNAGNIFKTAWGVMSAGANTVLTAIYGLGAAFTETAALILKGAILINENLQKIAFGSAKDRIIRETGEMRLALAGLEGVSTEFGVKARESLDDVAAGAKLARDGFSGLTGATKDAEPQVQATGAALGEVAQQLEATAEKNAKARAATEAKAAADAQASTAIQHLKDEYRAFVEAGDLQRAAEAFIKLETAQKASADAGKGTAKSAEDDAKRVEQAYQELGITSTETLKRLAEQAKTNYDIVRTSGKSSAEDVGNAFKVAAERAIAANSGIAPSWVQVEALARGYKVSVDDAGKATLELASKTGSATGSMNTSIKGVAGAWAGVVKELQNVDAATKRIQERNAQVSKNTIRGTTYDREGFATNSSGQRLAMELNTDESVAAMLVERGLSEDLASRLAPSVRTQLDSLGAWNGNTGGTISAGGRSPESIIQEALQASAVGGLSTEPQTNAAAVAPVQSGGITNVVNITLDSRTRRVPTTDAGATELRGLSEDFMRVLEQARGTSV